MTALLIITAIEDNKYQLDYANSFAITDLSLDINEIKYLQIDSLRQAIDDKTLTNLQLNFQPFQARMMERSLKNVSVTVLHHSKQKKFNSYCIVYKCNQTLADKSFHKELIHAMNNALLDLSFGLELAQLHGNTTEKNLHSSIAKTLSSLQLLVAELKNYHG